MSRFQCAFRIVVGLRVVLRVPALLTGCGLAWGGCGIFGGITLGTGTQNDPAPSGTIVAQGPFGGVNGRTVSGNVTVYSQPSTSTTCTFVVRLQNLSAPSDAQLYVVPIVNGAPATNPASYPLRSPTGNENYKFNEAPCALSFAQIQLANPVLQPVSAQNYGIANLTQLTP